MSAQVYFLPGALEARTKAREAAKRRQPKLKIPAQPEKAPDIHEKIICLLLNQIAADLGLVGRCAIQGGSD